VREQRAVEHYVAAERHFHGGRPRHVPTR
jgi:hypothetical protein